MRLKMIKRLNIAFSLEDYNKLKSKKEEMKKLNKNLSWEKFFLELIK